ncbi:MULTISPECIES: putative leader peptide [unclassified Streptomyces]
MGCEAPPLGAARPHIDLRRLAGALCRA